MAVFPRLEFPSLPAFIRPFIPLLATDRHAVVWLKFSKSHLHLSFSNQILFRKIGRQLFAL
jgi:hypothetical protein